MTKRKPKYSKEEHARLGTALYEKHVRPLVETGNRGKIVAIDVDSGAFEVADDTLAAAGRMFARNPDAQSGSSELDTRAFTASGRVR